MQKKLFVLDTNVLLHDPQSLFKFHEHDVFISFTVLEELDSLKSGTQERNRTARAAIRLLGSLIEGQDLANGVPLSNPELGRATGTLFMQQNALDATLPLALPVKADNNLLTTVFALKGKFPEIDQVVLVTKDLNLRIKAVALGLVAEDYLHDHVIEDADLIRRGIVCAGEEVMDSVLDSRHADKGTLYKLSPLPELDIQRNEMLHLDSGLQLQLVDAGASEWLFKSLRDYSKNSNALWGVSARNEEQNFAMNLLMDPNIDFVALLGPAGTGKTLLTLAAAIEQVMTSKLFDDIIFTRATVSLGEDIGFLPGTEEEKMAPWLGALEDNLDVLAQGGTGGGHDADRKASRSVIRDRIKVKSVAFMRGRTFHRKFVILDEAQNLTPKQMKALITRAGPGTKLVALGNLAQIDTPYLSETSSGLTHAVEGFRGWGRFASVILNKGERSELASYANDHL